MISDGQDANAAVTNAAFVSKTVSDAKVGDLTLNDKLSLQDSGSATMTDAQLEINNLKDEFNPSTGHGHDGTDSKKVLATNLDSTGGSNGQVLKADGAGLVTWENDTGTGAVNYKGSWNANTNTPTLTSGAGAQGDYYVVSVLGTTTLDGISDWEVTDWAVFNGTIWEKIDNTDTVVSVAGKTGAVTLDADDISETASKFWAYKSNVTTADPTVSNDSSQGYSVGSRWWNSSTNTLFIAESVGVGTAVWEGVSGSGGGGGLDVYHSETFETTVAADFTTGNNATFDNGGTLQGALLDETTNPINGLSSLKYTQAVGSLNDWVKSPLINIFDKQGGNETGVTLYFTYDGDASDIKLVLYDETNTTVLTDVVDVFTSESNPTRFTLSAYIPTGVTQLAYGFQVLVENSGAILLLDDIELSTNPFVYKNILDQQDYHIEQSQNALTNLSGEIEFNLGTATILNNGTGIIYAQDDSGNTRTKFIALKKCLVTISASGFQTVAGNQAQIIKYNTSDTEVLKIVGTTEDSGSGFDAGVTASIGLNSGEYFTVNYSQNLLSNAALTKVSFTAQAETEHVITPVKQNLISQVSYTPVFSAITPTNVNVRWSRQGKYLTLEGGFTWGSATGATFEIYLPVIDGIQLTADLPDTALVEHSVGRLYANLAVTSNHYNLFIDDTIPNRVRMGRLGDTGAAPNSARAGTELANGTVIRLTSVRIPITQWDDNVAILGAIPTLRTAYVKDLKSSGVSGGSSSTNTVHTRDLNTLTGDTNFISLSTNQFTLQAGKYEIEAIAPAYRSDAHQLFLYNVTDSTYDIDGKSMYTNNAQATSVDSALNGQIIISSSKTYEIRHWVTTAKASNGLGVSSAGGTNNPASNNVYTQVKITKVK